MTNKKSTKRALISSAVALLLCFSMLIGTTFAWFTDSVSSAKNQIIAGNLDVELYFKNSQSTDWEKVDENTNIFLGTLWEPGHTEAVQFKIVNEGSLALKYQLGVNIASETGSVNVDEKPFKLSDHIYFGMINEARDFGQDRAGAVAAVKDTAKKINEGYSKGDVLDPAKSTTEAYLTMVVYMPENIGNEANAMAGAPTPTVNLGINLFATQVAAEMDSFGDDYDADASNTVASVAELREAINNAAEGEIIFVENGNYTLDSMIVIEGKSLSIVGLGEVTFTTTAAQHMFTIQDSNNPESDMVVNISNINLDGANTSKHGFNVKYNVTANFEDVTVKNTGWAGILLDNANKYTDGNFYDKTRTTVNLKNCSIESVSLDALPVIDTHAYANAGVDTYTYFNYDADSTVGSIEVQSITKKPENIIINGVSADAIGTTMYFNVTNDAELAAALETIKTNEAYWNKEVIINMAAGEYSADHVINQYPQWNGVVGAGTTANNYAGGVPAGAPGTVITFIGEGSESAAYSLRSSAPSVVFTGNVTVNGFGNAGTGFNSTFAVTTFQNIAFDGSNIEADSDGNVIGLKLVAAADNIKFNNCVFSNTTHITLGGRAENRIDNVDFVNCSFNDAGSLSGYPLNVTMKDCNVDGAKDGFLNIQNKGTVTVERVTANVGRFFIRTNGSEVNINVKESDITLYESEGTKHLVYFRGSNESATFTDCTISDGYTFEGVDENSTLAIYNYSEIDGLTLRTDGVTGDVKLCSVSDEAPATLTIPEGVTALGSKILDGNTTVEKVVIPSTMKDFGGSLDSATSASGGFFYKSAVKTIVLPEGMTSIPAAAFNGASNLETVEIPDTVKSIGVYAFRGTALTTLEISENVEEIGYGAFRDMTALTTVTIKGDVMIPGYAFRGCTNLTSVNLEGTNVTFGNGGQIFVNTTAGDASKITITVANKVIEDRLRDANTSASGYTVICKQTNVEDEEGNDLGYSIDESGNAYVYDNTALTAAMKDERQSIILGSGNYNMPDGSDLNLQGKTLTIKGNENTVVDASNVDERDQYVTGATLVFDGVTINFGTVNYMGFANATSLVYKNCTINGLQFLYGPSVTFENCAFNSNGAEHSVWTWGVQNVSFTDCDFTYSDRAINCYGEGVTTNASFTNCTFTKVEGKETTGAIETNSSTLVALNLTINNCSVNEGDLWWVSTWDAKGGANTYTTVDGKVTVGTAKQLAAVVAKGATDIYLMDGEYNVENCGGKTLTINGSEKAVIKLYNEGEDGCDYGFGGNGTGVGNVTFNGVTIDTTSNTGNYKGFAYMKGTFNDCNFVGAYSLNNANDFVFNRCTFDFKNGYFWTWGANSVTFDGCTFGGNSKTILAHGYASTVITIKDCDFTASEQGYTGAGDNTAAVEIDPAGTNTYTINFTGENTITDSYAGWTRIKDGSTGHTITGLN